MPANIGKRARCACVCARAQALWPSLRMHARARKLVPACLRVCARHTHTHTPTHTRSAHDNKGRRTSAQQKPSRSLRSTSHCIQYTGWPPKKLEPWTSCLVRHCTHVNLSAAKAGDDMPEQVLTQGAVQHADACSNRQSAVCIQCGRASSGWVASQKRATPDV